MSNVLHTRSRLISLIIGADIFFLDRLHKYFQIEIEGWRGGEFVQVTSFFNYVLVWNTGISYGLFSGVPSWVLLVIMGVAVGALGVWWFTSKTVWARFGLMAILGGAISHVIDRVVYGAVPDFFHFHWQDYSFYVFNISDMAITFGVILLLIDALRPQPQTR